MLFALLCGCVTVVLVWWLLKGDSDLTLFLYDQLSSSKSTAEHYNGKVIWITGASSGIGENIAYHLSQYKCKLILSARRVPELETVKQSCLEKSAVLTTKDIEIIPLDLTDFDSLGDKVDKAYAIFGQIDIVIHNAGRSQRADWANVETEVDLDCYKINALGPVMLTRKLLPKWLGSQHKNCRKQIVAVSSLAGVVGAPLSPSYSAAKHALNGYFRSLWVEHDFDGVDVTIFCPGSTYAPNNPKTAFTDTLGKNHGELQSGPTTKQLLPERVAELVCLASARGLLECWTSKETPLLILCYISILCPGIASMICRFIGKERLRQRRTASTN